MKKFSKFESKIVNNFNLKFSEKKIFYCQKKYLLSEKMTKPYHYNLDLPLDVNEILEHDFWMLDHVHPMMLRSLSEPVKFDAHTWIYIRKGVCQGEISLINHEIKAPSLVLINSSQILLPKFISDDFDAAVIVMSRRFHENLFLVMANAPLYTQVSRHVVVPMQEPEASEMELFLQSLTHTMENKSNPYMSNALVFEFAAFIFNTLYKCYEQFKNELTTVQGRMAKRFMSLVQENYKKERFLDFYASKLEVSPKHLSRTIKSQTGFSAVEWIERFVILEAKVLLRSSNLNIQQIADELNFPSQSFFGKYFKKQTGMSPKEFRNT